MVLEPARREGGVGGMTLTIYYHGTIRDGRATYCFTSKRPQKSASHASFRQTLNFNPSTKKSIKMAALSFKQKL